MTARDEKIIVLSTTLKLDPDIVESAFNYLDILCETGATNMYGATPYLIEDNPDLTRGQAKEILIGWMKSFNK